MDARPAQRFSALPSQPQTPPTHTSAVPYNNSFRIYRPSFRENKPKMLCSNDRKQGFWACFRENWVYKFRHKYEAPGNRWVSLLAIELQNWNIQCLTGSYSPPSLATIRHFRHILHWRNVTSSSWLTTKPWSLHWQMFQNPGQPDNNDAWPQSPNSLRTLLEKQKIGDFSRFLEWASTFLFCQHKKLPLARLGSAVH